MKILIILTALATVEILLLKWMQQKKLIPMDADGTYTETQPTIKSKIRSA